jgi:hypothetical protein
MTKRIRIYLNFDENDKDDMRISNMLLLIFDSAQKRNKFVTSCVKKEFLRLENNSQIDVNFDELNIKKRPQSTNIQKKDIETKNSKQNIPHNGFKRAIINAKDKLLTNTE